VPNILLCSASLVAAPMVYAGWCFSLDQAWLSLPMPPSVHCNFQDQGSTNTQAAMPPKWLMLQSPGPGQGSTILASDLKLKLWLHLAAFVSMQYDDASAYAHCQFLLQ
jgi:hypothetical protein